MRYSAFMQAIKEFGCENDPIVAIFALTEDTNDGEIEILGEVGSVMTLDDGHIGIGIMPPSKEANDV